MTGAPLFHHIHWSQLVLVLMSLCTYSEIYSELLLMRIMNSLQVLLVEFTGINITEGWTQIVIVLLPSAVCALKNSVILPMSEAAHACAALCLSIHLSQYCLFVMGSKLSSLSQERFKQPASFVCYLGEACANASWNQLALLASERSPSFH